MGGNNERVTELKRVKLDCWLKGVHECDGQVDIEKFTLISGIFAYLNYLTPKSRKEILELLVGGLKRLEYRGYDSAGKLTTSSFWNLFLFG